MNNIYLFPKKSLDFALGGGFDEFCNFQKGREDCTTEFMVGSTDVRDFSHTLNDGIFPKASVNFTLEEQHVDSDLVLILSTSDSSYPGKEPNFELSVSLQEE
jgi:hypothetical protein